MAMHARQTAAEERTAFLLYLSVVVLAVVVRNINLPDRAFFCDVPAQVQAIESGRFLIQFPGYAPYHRLIAFIQCLGTDAFGGMVLFSLFCGIATVVYVTATAEVLAGRTAAIVSGTVMAVGPLPVYFSVVGASYTTDMLYVSGMFFHGIRAIHRQSAKHFCLTAAWFVFGVLMRPLSAATSALGLFVIPLIWKSLKYCSLSAAAFIFSIVAYCWASVYEYGSMGAFLGASSIIERQVSGTSWQNVVTNTFRFLVYPAYSFNIWVLFSAATILRYWHLCKRNEACFVAAVVCPYMLILLRYIPHAGYWCLVIPAMAILPWLFIPSGDTLLPRSVRVVVGTHVLVSLMAFMLLRPIATTNRLSAAANAYLLQYTRTGIKQAVFGTLSSFLVKEGVPDDAIPEQRRREILDEGKF